MLPFELDISRKWNIARKAFTLKTLNLEEKKAIFDSIAKTDSSDKKVEEAHVFDAITASKEHFEELYQTLKSPDRSISMTVKQLITAGWRNQIHYEWLSTEYREKYFKDIISLSSVLDYSQLQFFYNRLKPLDDNIQSQLDSYRAVVKQLEETNDESGELKVHAKEIMRIVDDLEKKKANYAFNSAVKN